MHQEVMLQCHGTLQDLNNGRAPTFEESHPDAWHKSRLL